MRAPPNADPEELVRRALSGDAQARTSLARLALPQVKTVARAMLRPADAEDAMQSALLTVLQRLSSWRGEGGFEQWTRAVAARVCLRVLRDQRRQRVREWEAMKTEPSSTPASAGAAVFSGELRRLLEQLDPDRRDVLVLKHCLGHTTAEIAEMLDMPIDTVKSRLLTARRELRRVLRRDRVVRDMAAKVRIQGGAG